MHQSIESTPPPIPGTQWESNGGMAGQKRYCNKALSRGDGASKRLETILPICNAWPDREAMGPSSNNLRSGVPFVFVEAGKLGTPDTIT